MKRNIVTLVLFALVAFAPLANSQNTTCSLIPGPCAERYARQAYAPIDRIVGQLDQQAQNYGGYYPGVVGISGGNRTATVIGLAATGAGIGYALGGRNGAIIGGGAGVVGGILATRTRNVDAYGGQKQVDCSKRKLNKKEQSICEQALAEQQAQAQQQQVNAEMAERQRIGKRLQNKTGFPVEICDCNQMVGTLRSGQSMPALEARCGYTAQMLVPDPTTPGITVRRDAEFHIAPDMSGWVFVAPRISGGSR